MERFTNNRMSLFEEVKKELTTLDSPKEYQTLFYYLEVSQLLAFAYSFVVLESLNKKDFKYFLKIWDSKYDASRFNLGIYNLDRLAIKDIELILQDNEHSKIQNLCQNRLNIVEISGFTLDGLFCQLNFPSKNINLLWNSDSEMNLELQDLVLFLRKIAQNLNVYE
jgi:hypothetical protein